MMSACNPNLIIPSLLYCKVSYFFNLHLIPLLQICLRTQTTIWSNYSDLTRPGPPKGS